MKIIYPPIPRHFTNLDAKWRSCELCGKYTYDRPSNTDGEDDTEVTGGRLRPESELVKYEGKWYCPQHFQVRWGSKLSREAKLNIKEIDDV